MHTTKTIENIGKAELAASVGIDASWHQDYSHSAYIFAGGLNYGMNEGDIAIVFSQYSLTISQHNNFLSQRFGEIVDVRLVRDKKTGKSKGFAFICYEDQRSTVLAVDNFNNSEICGRRVRVDHVKKYRPPKEFLELKENNVDFESELYKPSGPDGRGWGKYREYTEEEKEEISRIKEEEKLKKQSQNQMLDKLQSEGDRKKEGKIILDVDERWESIFMNKLEDEKDIEKEKKRIKKQLKLEKKQKKKEKKQKKKEKEEKSKEKHRDKDKVKKKLKK